MDVLQLVGFGQGGWGKQLLGGAVLTVEIAAASYGVGMVLGLLGAWAKLSESRAVTAAATLYTSLVRGIPEILVIFLIYYGGTSAIRTVAGLVAPDVQVEIGAFAAAVAALGFIAGAYSTEIFRGSLIAVEAGQREAAKALSLPAYLAFALVVLPQAMRVALPPLGNLWLVVLKDSALISVVGLRDLLGVGATAALSTRKPFTFYVTVALIFLAISVLSMVLFHLAERRFARGAARR
jgi:His/Glu/Gln/Arg/opine family amino acid ABC transporter permease subunit